ncbi:MAG TPA: biotin/lipoyl-containing protein [Chloroflexota bacterium]|nr:biotin/lipoyl-containing protein [Chloroflexota bacterium]
MADDQSLDNAAGRDDPILAALRELLPLLEQQNVTALDVSVGETHLSLRRRPGAFPPSVAVTQGTEQEDESLVGITTPLSGVFYAAPAPDEPPYVREGDAVEAGQTVALVEAMKVFNEIHAEVPGTVEKIVATPGQVVSSGQVLMRLRPTAPPAAPGEAV